MENGRGDEHDEGGKVGKVGNGLSWDIWAVGNWGTTPPPPPPPPPPPLSYSFSFDPHTTTTHDRYTHRGGGGGGEAYHNLTCLKLGKRHYHEEGHGGVKKDRVLMVGSSSSTTSPAAVVGVVPRCQVEGCNVSLVDAKEYYKKHKVCGAHSKSPRVVVLGLEQRFCQQCSRFHAVSEFDDTRRSCRRRLAGHNERRRKISSDSIMRSRSHDNTMMGSRFSYLPPQPSTATSSGRVLSLLSAEDSPWVSPDTATSYQPSAALRELIAENRAVLLARQLYMEQQRTSYPYVSPFIPNNNNNIPHHDHQNSSTDSTDRWHNHLCDAAATNPHITLDLMQIACPSFDFLSKKNESKEDEDEGECCEIWKSLEETHVV